MTNKLTCFVSAVALGTAVAGLVLLGVPATASSMPTSSIITWTDNFDTPTLNGRWAWVREDPTHWSLAAHAGFLRITTQKGALLTTEALAKNLLVQDVPSDDFDIQTHLLFTPTQDIQHAGILAYQSDGNYMGVVRAFCDLPSICIGNAVYFDHVEQNQFIGSNFGTTTAVSGEAYLRLVRHRAVYTGYVSLNGTDWTMLGTHTVVSGFVPSKIGLTAFNTDYVAPEIPADFDFFRIDYSRSELFLPLVTR